MTDYEKQKQRVKYCAVSDGAMVAYEELGSGDEFIFCSMMDHGENSYVRKFADHGYHVILVWNRSSGPSCRVKPEDDYGFGWYDRWAQDVCDIADFLGAKQFVYTGASHGAGTGWHIMWRHPERLKACIHLVCGPHPLNGDVSCVRDKLKENPNFDPFNYPSDDPLVLRRRAENQAYSKDIQQDASPFNYSKPMIVMGGEEKLIELFRTFTTPVLMICGLEDVIIDPKYNLRTAQALQNCKLVMYSQAGHSFSHLEATEDTIEEALIFLRNLKENNGRIYKKLEE